MTTEDRAVLSMDRVPEKPAPPLRRAFGGRYGFLLTSLLTLVALSPAMVARRMVLISPIDLLVFTIMLAGVRAATPGRRALIYGLCLTAIAIALHCAAYWLKNQPLLVAHHALTVSALVYAQVTILTAIVEDTQVTLETLKAAVCVYLLIGLACAFAFAIVAVLVPDSFMLQTETGGHAVAHLTIRSNFPDLMYFSFATLTTLGYADLIPHGPYAQTLCYVEAVFGQIYVTILIARLVGMHISRYVEAKDVVG